MKKIRKKVVLCFATVGLLLPLGLDLARVVFRFSFGSWTVWLWPSSIWFLALDGNPSTAFAAQIYAMSLIANVLLYAAGGFIVSILVCL